MKPIIAPLLFAILLLGFFSCKEEEQIAPYQGRIKRVLHFGSIENTVPWTIDEYQYDSRKRLIKTQNNHQAVLYEYDKDNRLNKEYYYNTNGDNSTLSGITSYAYTYMDGMLVSKETNSVSPNSQEVYNYKELYEYENAKLVKKKSYSGHHFDRMILNEYTGDLLTKEIEYRDSLEVNLNTITSNYFNENNQLVVVNKAYKASSGMAWFQSIYYFYNEHGDLDLEYSEQSDQISAGITYCMRYEYE